MGGCLSPTRPRRASRNGLRAGVADLGPRSPLEGLGVRAGQEGVFRLGFWWKRQERKKRGSYFKLKFFKKNRAFSAALHLTALSRVAASRVPSSAEGLPSPPLLLGGCNPPPAAALGSPAQAEGKGDLEGTPTLPPILPALWGRGMGGGWALPPETLGPAGWG